MTRASFDGSTTEYAGAISILFANGKLVHTAAPNDAVNEQWVVEHNTGLLHLFAAIEKYSMFVKGLLRLMSDERYG